MCKWVNELKQKSQRVGLPVGTLKLILFSLDESLGWKSGTCADPLNLGFSGVICLGRLFFPKFLDHIWFR